MSHTVADVLVGVLEQIGVKHIFGLIGDSLNPLEGRPLRRGKDQGSGARSNRAAMAPEPCRHDVGLLKPSHAQQSVGFRLGEL
jgi:hypothetical protein